MTQDGTNFPVEGLVTEDGHAVLISDFGIYAAQFDVDGNDFDNSFTAYAFLGTTWDGSNSVLTGNINGTISERNSIQAQYSLGAETGSVSLSYQSDVYDVDASESRITGTWGYTIPSTGYAISITFSSDGTFFGQDNDGCVYQGNWSIPDENYNGYRMTNTSINCGGGDTAWSGVALIYFDTGYGADVMVFGIHNAVFAYADFFIKS